MALRISTPLLLCGLLAVSANFLTEREWLAKNTGKTPTDYEDMLQAFHKKLSTERAEDHEAEMFAHADLDGDGKHSKEELVQDIMKEAGFELHKNGQYFEVAARESFAQADADKDGKVTQKEYLKFFKGSSAKDFKKNDADGDGVHTFEEEMALSNKHTKRSVDSSEESAQFYLKHGDKDGDGKLTKEEKRAALKEHSAYLDFTETDVNKDGKHSKEEIVEADMRRAGFMKHREGHYFEVAVEEEFENLDTDKDGKVTLKEFLNKPGNSEEAFKKTDSNKDGVHTMEELFIKPSPDSQKALKQATKFAAKAVADKDRDGDGFVSFDEYKVPAGAIEL